MTGERYHTLVLSGDAGIKAAQNVAASLRDALDSQERIGIDTQTLTGADITTVQTLLAARNSAAGMGKALAFHAPLAAPLRAVLEAGGFLGPGQPHAEFWSPIEDAAPGK